MFDLQKTIGLWGDSILKGVILSEKDGSYQVLSDGLAQQLVSRLGLTVLNKSRLGCTIEKGQQLLTRSLANGTDCSAILLEYGGNDSDFDWPAVAAAPDYDHQPKTPLNIFRATLCQMITQLHQHHITPILMSLPPINGTRYLDYLVQYKGLSRENLLKFVVEETSIYRFHESYSLAITQIANETRSIYIPMREAFLLKRDTAALLCADGIHPNRLGHELMRQVFTEVVEQWREEQAISFVAV